jgi:hypothetical protein
MPIDAKQIEEWRRAAFLAMLPGETRGLSDLADAVNALLAEREELIRSKAELARVLVSTSATPDAVPALLKEREEMLAVLREVEWAGDAGDGGPATCPSCGGYTCGGYMPSDAVLWHMTKPGHGPGCRLAALLREG